MTLLILVVLIVLLLFFGGGNYYAHSHPAYTGPSINWLGALILLLVFVFLYEQGVFGR